MSWEAQGASYNIGSYATTGGDVEYLSSSNVVGGYGSNSSFQPPPESLYDLNSFANYDYNNSSQVSYPQNLTNLGGNNEGNLYQQQLVNGGGSARNLDGGVYNVVKPEGEYGSGVSSFEASCGTSLTDISNYHQTDNNSSTGIHSWIGGGEGVNNEQVSSNWLQSIDGGVEKYDTPAALSTTSATPSLFSGSTSTYNFYDDDERECQKDLDEIMKLEMFVGEGAASSTSRKVVAEEEILTFAKKTKICHSAEVVNSDDEDHEENTDDEDDQDDQEEKSEQEGDDDDDEENESQNGSTSKTDVVEKKSRQFRSESCTLCDILFPLPSLFEKHMMKVHQEPAPYPCLHPACEKKFAKLHQRTQHEKVHDPNRYVGEGFWECGVCDKVYHVRCSLYQHWKSMHPDMDPAIRKKMVSQATARANGKEITKRVKAKGPSVGTGIGVTQKLKKLQNEKRRRKSVSKMPEEEQISKEPASPARTPSPASRPPPPPSAAVPVSEFPVEFSPDCRPGHYPCSVCEKVFTIPFNLRHHMSLHTGLKPYQCPHCDDTFRLKQTLNYHLQRRHRTKEDTRNILKLHKCRVCGKHDFVMFHELHSHRTRKHADVPYDKEKEKPFGCGICLRPYFVREDAIICALLAHDPTYLRKVMFKYKCPQCPKERPGYYKQSHLRKHWDDEHPDKALPSHLKKGTLWDDNPSLTLPYCRVNKVKATDIRENGLPSGTTFECPLYLDLTDFGPSEEEEHWMASIMLELLEEKQRQTDGHQFCTICGETLSNKGNLKRHLTSVHVSQDILNKEKQEEEEEVQQQQQREEGIGKPTPKKKQREQPVKMVAASKDEFQNIFQRVISSKKEGDDIDDGDSGGEEKGSTEQDEKQEVSSFKCRFCNKTFPKKRALHFHEVRGHINSSPTPPLPPPSKKVSAPRKQREHRVVSVVSSASGHSSTSSSDSDLFQAVNARPKSSSCTSNSVNVNDSSGVARLLNYKTAKVLLCRVLSSDIENILFKLRNSSKRSTRKCVRSAGPRRQGDGPLGKGQQQRHKKTKRGLKPRAKASTKRREIKTDNNKEPKRKGRPRKKGWSRRRTVTADVKNALDVAVDKLVGEDKAKKETEPMMVELGDMSDNKEVTISEDNSEVIKKVEEKKKKDEKKTLDEQVADDEVENLIAEELGVMNGGVLEEDEFDEDDLDDIIAEELEEMMEDELDDLFADKFNVISGDDDEEEDEEGESDDSELEAGKAKGINQVVNLCSTDEDEEEADEAMLDEFGLIDEDEDDSDDVEEEEEGTFDDEELIDDSDVEILPDEDPLRLDGEVAPSCELDYYDYGHSSSSHAPLAKLQITNGTNSTPSSSSSNNSDFSSDDDNFEPVIHANKANVTIATIKSPKVVLQQGRRFEGDEQPPKNVSLLCDRQSNNV